MLQLGQDCYTSPTPAALNNHLVIVLEHDFVILIQVQHGDGAQLCRNATSRFHNTWIDSVDQGLDYGVVRGIGVIGQGETALARAEEGVKARWRHNPVTPSHSLKVHLHGLALAHVAAAALLVSAVLPALGAGFGRSFRP